MDHLRLIQLNSKKIYIGPTLKPNIKSIGLDVIALELNDKTIEIGLIFIPEHKFEKCF